MPHPRTVLLVVLLAAFVLGSVVLYFAYGADDSPPRRVRIEGLAGPATVAWQPNDVVTIRAESHRDRAAALGYAHGMRRGWQAALWRQTARGRLSAWYGPRMMEMDRLTRRLGFGVLAEEAYTRLEPGAQALLAAYPRGMSAALRSEALRRQAAFALLGIAPSPWEPWHTLAVERLIAWLASPLRPLRESTVAVSDSASAFLAANRRLHDWLGLHGFAHSAAWAGRGDTATHFMQRQVYGHSALPLLLEVVLANAEGTVLRRGATLPGTPFFLAGRSAGQSAAQPGGHAWALLPLGTARLVRRPFDSTATLSHQRIRDAEGAEHLVAARRTPEALFLETPASIDTSALAPGLDSLAYLIALDSLRARADSVWQIRWAGFRPVSDHAAWQALASGEETSFRMMTGSGLRVAADGAWQVLGAPRVVRRVDEGVVVGNTFWTEHLADQIAQLAAAEQVEQAEQIVAARWLARDASTWAAALAPEMLAALDSLADSSRTRPSPSRVQRRLLREALTYLRNWSHTYDRAGIGASIFDAWARAYREATGRLPRPLTADTLAQAESLVRYRTLRRAVARLAERHGSDLRQWRWEEVAPHVYRFPGWRADTLAPGWYNRLVRTRYAPLVLPGRGHPSSLSWGVSPAERGPPAPAVWGAWTSTADGDRLHARRRRFDLDAVLGRYRTPLRRPAPVALDTTASAPTTTLLPAGR